MSNKKSIPGADRDAGHRIFIGRTRDGMSRPSQGTVTVNGSQPNPLPPQIGSIHTMKGCPHCRAMPNFSLRIRDGRRYYKIECLQHPDFLVVLPWFEDFSLILEEWQDDDEFIVMGAIPEVALSRPLYSVVLSES